MHKLNSNGLNQSSSYTSKILLPLIIVGALLTGCAKDPEYNKMGATQIYDMGLTAITEKKFSTAIKHFNALNSNFPYGKHTEHGKLAKIYALYKTQDYEENNDALSECDRFIKQYPKHPNVDYVYYMKGVLLFDNNFSEWYKLVNIDRSKRESEKAASSFASFKELLEKFPNSKYAYDAKLRMIYLREQIARLDYFIAKYYFDDGAYVAAVNRIAKLVKNYPQTKAARDGLLLLKQSYAKLKQPELVKLADQVIANNNLK